MPFFATIGTHHTHLGDFSILFLLAQSAVLNGWTSFHCVKDTPFGDPSFRRYKCYHPYILALHYLTSGRHSMSLAWGQWRFILPMINTWFLERRLFELLQLLKDAATTNNVWTSQSRISLDERPFKCPNHSSAMNERSMQILEKKVKIVVQRLCWYHPQNFPRHWIQWGNHPRDYWWHGS